MFTREAWTPLVVLGLFLAFWVVSALVWCTRGQTRLVRAKLRIGGWLLLANGMAAGAGCREPTCYDTGVDTSHGYDTGSCEASVHLRGANRANIIDLDLAGSNHLVGTSTTCGYDGMPSYDISDANGKVVQSADLVPLDGRYDNKVERFEILVDPSLPAGTYALAFYDGRATENRLHQTRLATFTLIILGG